MQFVFTISIRTTDKIVQAADQFLAALREEQRWKVMDADDDEQQQFRWSNFPAPVIPPGGIRLQERTSQQLIPLIKSDAPRNEDSSLLLINPKRSLALRQNRQGREPRQFGRVQSERIVQC